MTVIAVFEAANVVAVAPAVVEPSVKAAAYMVEGVCVCGAVSAWNPNFLHLTNMLTFELINHVLH